MVRRFELRHLDAFLAVCETRHFGRAALRLNVSQPALSRAVQQLEAALGVALFERDSRNVRLTDAGAVLREHSTKLIEHVNAAEQQVHLAGEGRAGHLTVAYVDFALSGLLPETLQRFRQSNPHVEIQLVRIPTDIQKEVLQSGGADVGFLLGKCSGVGIQSLLVEEQQFVALLPSQHPLAQHTQISIDILLREPLVLGTLPEYSAFRRIVQEEAARYGVRPRVVQETSTSDGIFALVAAGVGVSLYTKGAAELVRSGVAIKSVTGAASDVDLYMAWSSSRLSAVTAKFIEEMEVTLDSARVNIAKSSSGGQRCILRLCCDAVGLPSVIRHSARKWSGLS